MIRNNFQNTWFKLNGSATVMLDLIRALSAFFVLITHLRGFLFVPFVDVENKNILLQGFYFITSIGPQAVIIFFVLSGFFISGTVLNSYFENTWSWKNYLINRLSRLYTVLLPALILTLFLDKLGMWLFQLDNYYSEYPPENDFFTFLGNLFFLQNILVPVYGTDGPLWSLNYEFWYYILFPLILLGLFKGPSLKKKIIFTVLSLTLLIFVGKVISLYFFIWLLGTFILISPPLKRKVGYKSIAISLFPFVLFLISLYVSRLSAFGTSLNVLNRFYGDLLVGINFSVMVYVILQLNLKQKGEIQGVKHCVKKVSKFFADFSFTLYLVHYPIMAFLMSWYNSVGGEKLQPTIFNIIIFLALAFLFLLIAYCISLLTETHTSVVRLFIKSIFLKKKSDTSFKKVS